MIAYKVLEADGTGRFSGFRWPLPNGAPGDWVDGEVDPCRSGVHALRPSDLPYWLGPSLFEIELDGPISEIGLKVVATRGRLLRRVDAWDDPMRLAFSTMCIERARELAASDPQRLNAWVNADIDAGPALLGYVAERIAEEIEGPAAGKAERESQARWLSEHLQLGA